jgi:hypothetical protein
MPHNTVRLRHRKKGDVMTTTDLGFDQEQLAAALERVEFTREDVERAIKEVSFEGAASVGVFPMQGQAQFQIFASLVFREGEYFLYIVAFDNDREYQDPEYAPNFAVTLAPQDCAELTSLERESSDTSATIVRLLDDPEKLIDAQLTLVV